MTWTDQQWDAVASLLEHGWPGAFGPEAGDAYRVLLATADPGDVVLALQILARRGGTFRPSAGEILATATGDPGRPTFDEAFAALFQRVDGRRPILTLGSEQAAFAAADELHPFVGAFLRAQGFDRMRLLEWADPEFGALRVRELRAAYNLHVEACEERVRTGRALEAAGRGRQIGPRRLDPLGLLGISPPVAELAETTGDRR